MDPLPKPEHSASETEDSGCQPSFQDTDTRALMSAQALGQGAALDPHLIDNFKAARLRLRRMADFIQRHADAGHWDTVEQGIDKFRSKLTDHLLIETFKLYSNTRQQLKEYPEQYEYIKTYGIEMGNLCNEIVQFTEANQRIASSPALQTQFPPHWAVLIQRLRRRWQIEEEQLYPVYLQLLRRNTR